MKPVANITEVILKHKKPIHHVHTTFHVVYWLDAAMAMAHGPLFAGMYLSLACLTFMVAYIQEHE